MPISIELDGLVRIQRNIDTSLNEGLLVAGEQIQSLASQLAPKDSGELANSGETRLAAPRLVEVSFGNNLPDGRAVAQEFGSVFMPAQPYLGPALRAIDVGLEVSKALKKRI